jgi:MFS superfamily sulfate permease-like transporter
VKDLIAGLSIAGLLLPEAVAYSGIANLPPQAGIIALFAGLLCYALLGTSRYAIVSATSSSAAVLAAATASLAGGDAALRLCLAAGLVLVTGALFVVAGAARLGSVTNFIAKPVLRGFAFGLALVISLKQFAAVVAVHPAGSDQFSFVAELVGHWRSWNLAGLATGAAALAALALLSRVRNLPAGLLVIAAGIAATHFLPLTAQGVAVVGPIHLALQAPALPALPRADWLRLGEVGMAMVMILYSESYGSIRSFAIKHGDPVDANRDLVALGASNLASGLFGGAPVGAGYSATSANDAAGATSRYAGLAAAFVMLLLALTVLPYIALTPEPVLAAIVIHAVSHSLQPAQFRPYLRWHRDRIVAATAVIAVLMLGVLDGLLVAIGISLAMMLRRLSQTEVAVLGRLGDGHDFVSMRQHPEARALPDLMILRPEEPMFFANAERILGEARHLIAAAGDGAQAVVVSLEESFDLDSTSVEALGEFFDWIDSTGKRLVLARLKAPVQALLQQVFAARAGCPIFTDLSVDDAVRLARAPGSTESPDG